MMKTEFAIVDHNGNFQNVHRLTGRSVFRCELMGNRTTFKTLKGAKKAIEKYTPEYSTNEPYQVIESAIRYRADVYQGEIELYEYQSYSVEYGHLIGSKTKELAIAALKEKTLNKLKELESELSLINNYK